MVNHLTRDALIEKSEIEDFLPKQSKSNKQNLDNLVAYRTFSVDNILSIQLLDSIQPEDDKAIKTNKPHNEHRMKMNLDTKATTVKQQFDNFFVLQHHLWHPEIAARGVCPLNADDLLSYKPTSQSISYGL